MELANIVAGILVLGPLVSDIEDSTTVFVIGLLGTVTMYIISYFIIL